MIKNIKIKNKQGKALLAVLYQPRKVRAAVILSHGFALDKEGPSGLFVVLAKQLYKKGFLVVRFDFARFGREKGFDFFASFDDLQQVIVYARKFTDKICLVGHSLGGFISLGVAAREKVHAVVLWSPPLALRLPRRMGRFAEHYRLSAPQTILMLMKYIFSRQKLRSEQYFQKLHIPVMLLYGTRDQFSEYAGIERLRKYRNVQLVKLEGLDHYYADFKQEVLAQTVRWIVHNL